MPSNRRLKATGFIILLTILVVFYVTNGAKSTYDSPFYTRTVAAIKNRQDAEAREAVLADEKQRMERVARVRQEHDAAISAAAAEETSSVNGLGKAARVGVGADGQRPLAEDVKEAAGVVGNAAKQPKDAISGEAQRPVAGRKVMKDGKVVVNDKASGDDGVARVGNTGAQETSNSKGEISGPETEDEQRVEAGMNTILKKGPIIIFSKSYCPYSRKAKDILLGQYSITPPPYVVELDQHELGAGLQAALEKSTGRRTVPNVLINGKSIGGGDEVAQLHEEGGLASMIKAMGGKRIMEVRAVEERVGAKFRA